MPTLVVIRHAKADNPPGVEDFGRPLTPQGQRDARAAGGWVRSTVGRPGLVLCSPARRAVETAEGVLAAYAPELPTIVYEERLYEASLGDLLHVVRGVDEEEVVVLVGHNPSVSALVADLTAGLSAGLSTCGVAVVRVPSAWPDTPSASCELIELTTARG
jgi:phosphohistidine phosphatase